MESLVGQTLGTNDVGEFTQAVNLHFRLIDFKDPSEALARLQQTTTFRAYQECFKRLSHQVDGLTKNFLIRSFIAGLRDNIFLDMKIKQPRSLAKAISIAHLVEERNQLQGKIFLQSQKSTNNCSLQSKH